MTTVLDAKIVPKVAATLEKYGRNITLRTYPSSTVDVVNSRVTPNASTDYTIKGSPPVEYSRYFVNGDTIKSGDCYIVILPKDITGVSISAHIKEGAIFLIDGKTWKCVSFITHSPGDDVAAYEIQLRS